MSGPTRRLVVLLIRPSRYDDDGYVVRHWRGTLPSNTLSCLYSLTEEAVRSGAFDGIEVQIEAIDEIVSRVDPAQLGRRFRRAGTVVVVGLVGVQTNQLPRAQDLASQFQGEGFDVVIGGFHVSGAMAMAATTPPECQAMLDAGVTLVLGEVEGRWSGILQDAVANRLQPLYDFLDAPPDLADVPLPQASPSTQRRFVMAHNGTIDAGRGCPFACSFCTIINVQGRKMRARSAAQILEQVRRNYRLTGRGNVRHYFFTDDNFARNPEWERIFDGLARLRDAEGMDVDFMMQVDTQAARIPGFVEKAARAGCVQVFIGIESVRDDNLAAGGKPQNKAADYREMIARWHEVGVVCHAGVIIGFPNDTYDRVMEDVRALAETILVDQVSFFMLMPLPGSQDHQAAVLARAPLDPDYNNYDGFHVTVPHPRMSPAEWSRAFRDAWTEFYSFEHMRRILLAQNPHTYWPVLKIQLWYRAGMIEGAHPMVTGLFRLKDRTSRRPTFPTERRWPFFRRRAGEIAHVLREYAKLYFEMQHLWLLTRIRRDDYWFLGDIGRLGPQSVREVKLAWGRVHTAVALKLAVLQGRVGGGVQALSATMAERVDVVREVLGSRAAGVRASLPHAPSLADLRLTGLPPVARGTWLARTLQRFNPLSMERLEHHPAAAVNLIRGARGAVVFLLALRGERYLTRYIVARGSPTGAASRCYFSFVATGSRGGYLRRGGGSADGAWRVATLPGCCDACAARAARYRSIPSSISRGKRGAFPTSWSRYTRSMTSRKTGSAVRPPVSFRPSGRSSSKPIRTATVIPDVP